MVLKMDELEMTTNVCEICGMPISGSKKQPDHNHKTIRIRDTLCHHCNLGIGFFNDNTSVMKKSVIYLKECRADPYGAMLLYADNDFCIICGKRLSPNNKCIDYDHETGLFRSILCNKCNNGLNMFDDVIELIQNAINYLIKYETIANIKTEKKTQDNIEKIDDFPIREHVRQQNPSYNRKYPPYTRRIYFKIPIKKIRVKKWGKKMLEKYYQTHLRPIDTTELLLWYKFHKHITNRPRDWIIPQHKFGTRINYEKWF